MRAGIALVAFGALEWFAACSDNPPGPCTSCPPPPPGLNVSNPVPSVALASGVRGGVALASSSSDVVYVSLAPGTVPTGSHAAVRRVGDATALTTPVADGGFDPVPVAAQVGDAIDIVITDASGSTVFEQRVFVAAARPPVVVRTEPPPRKRDVPLNASFVIVFSEPIDSTSLTTSSIQLRKGTTVIPGTVRFVDPTDLVAAFEPTASLDSTADYELVITTGIHDRDGQPLDSEQVVPFTTGTSSLAGIASVQIFADTFATFPSVGSSWQLIAVARDSNNAVVVGRPVTWVSKDVTIATVSVSGILRGIAKGNTQIVATVEGVASFPKFVSVQ